MGIVVTVEDAGHRLPLPQSPGPGAVSGRGLAIVASIAAAWGSWAVPNEGKFVWFRLARRAGLTTGHYGLLLARPGW